MTFLAFKEKTLISKEQEYLLLHIPVNAFMNVDKDLLSILKKGSLHGNFSEPHKTVCSSIWLTPVESIGVVRKATLETNKKQKEFSTKISGSTSATDTKFFL